MSKHFVELDGHFVNVRQVCYVRDRADGGTAIGFHGGVWTQDEDSWSNELVVWESSKKVVEAMEAALQEGGEA